MNYSYRNDLKIEFRAVPYTSDGTRVLEYRISPDQDLAYEENISWLWGLIKFKRKRKFSTKWVKAKQFIDYPSAYLYEEDHNYLPIFIRERKDLETYKYNYKTIGNFYDMIAKYDAKEKAEWQIKRNDYLNINNNEIWE